jgi:polyisoprenyl-phosphate glycosyltransferase
MKLDIVENKSTAKYTLSIITPVLNEESSILPFLQAIKHVSEGKEWQLEVLFIDDGSTDNTIDVIAKASQNYAFVRYIKLSRNFGKEAALTAGIDHAIGDAVIPMDVDLQDPPELIPKFVELWKKGYDTVYAVRTVRSKDSKMKRNSAKLFYKLFNKLSDYKIPENAGDYRLIDKKVVDAIKSMPERNRFLKGLFAWPGYKSIGINYERPARFAGKTKFNYWKLWNFGLDGLVSFSTWPLRVWSYIGASIAFLSFIYVAIIVLKVLIFGKDLPGYASLMSAIMFFGGLQLLSMGILGEYVSRMFMESKNRPIYLVQFDSKETKVVSDEKRAS